MCTILSQTQFGKYNPEECDAANRGCVKQNYKGWEEVLEEEGRKWSGSVNEKVHKVLDGM